ncbi:MAG TPA: hypothetical protein VMB53_06980 [Gaiellaceae bacterium]|nr:hypothetical protein [Gaiellaceae bacterium]
MSEATFLPVYFAKLDAGEDVVPMLAPDFTFSLLWATDAGAQEFAGSFDAFEGYLAQRDPDGQLHHISKSLRDGSTEVASGWTTRHGEPLGSFTFAVELDDDGRVRRLFAARTETFDGVPF